MEPIKSQEQNQQIVVRQPLTPEQKEQRRKQAAAEAMAEIMKKNKALFLQYFKEIHIQSAVCEKLGLDPSNISRWRHDDKEFNDAFNQVELNRHQEFRDRLYKHIKKDSLPAIIFYLGRRDPEFKFKAETTLTPLSPVEQDINQFLNKRHGKLSEFEATIKRLEAGGKPGADRDVAQDKKQAGPDSAVQIEPSPAVVLEKQNPPQPDTQS